MLLILVMVFAVAIAIGICLAVTLLQKDNGGYKDLGEHKHSGLCNTYIELLDAIQQTKAKNLSKLYLNKDCVHDVVAGKYGSVNDMFDVAAIAKKHNITIKLVKEKPHGVQTLERTHQIRDNFALLEEDLPLRLPQEEAIQFTPPPPKSKLMVLHLKVGADCIQHYSKIHDMTYEAYDRHLRQLYTDAIDAYIDKDTIVYICTPYRDDPLIKHVREASKTVLMKPKEYDRLPRELAAAVEMSLVRTHFTGNSEAILPINSELKRGSSFATWLTHHCNFKAVHELDLDFITIGQKDQ